MTSKKKILFITAAVLLLSVSCSKKETVLLRINNVEISTEVVRTPEARQKGLMNRKKLGEYNGMLFIFENDQKMSFWMKNTSIPLSIAYVSRDGVIKEIYDMEPFSEASVRSVRSVAFALEVNQGFFREHDITEGDRIIFPEGFILR